MRLALRRSTLPAVLVALSLSVAACGGGDDDSGSDEPKTVTDSKAAPPETWPLTGLVAKQGADEDHPVLVLKMDNTEASSPQQGLGSADMVVEELVEGGITRLAAFYYSEIPGVVGPVRSVRASDIGIVSPVDGTLVTSGGAGVTLSRLKEAGVPLLTEGSAGFRRDDTRSAPYNLFTDLGAVAKGTEDGKEERPADYLPWGDEGDFKGAKPASTLTADFGGSHSSEWSYQGGHYVNLNSFAPADDQFQADNVLVLRVDIGDAGYLDPAGNPVPETKFVGDGDALLFHDGKLEQGTWHKDELSSAVTLSTDGGEMKVPAGHTFIELVPVDAKGGSISWQK
ncbi:MAG TPA: DUF3048 domain-containing protein [Nocardioides sp.]|nr:DUF3048 domain-containing protein [Nocardioides sp.]